MKSGVIGALIAAAYFALVPHLYFSGGQEQTIEGRVIVVAEGDALTLNNAGARVAVRLSNIDAPELGQPYGVQSRESLAALALGKTLRCRENGRDRFGQPAWRCSAEKIDVNAEQVRRGMAWAFARYRNDDAMQTLHDDARAAKRGLWKDPGAIAPWSWSSL